MKVAFDLHGVITAEPEAYKSVMATLCQTDNSQVWVISGPKRKEIETELKALGFEQNTHYHGIASVVDYLVINGNKFEIDDNGNYWFDENKWWGTKADICRELKIDVLTDDHEEYGKYFTSDHPTNFILKK